MSPNWTEYRQPETTMRCKNWLIWLLMILSAVAVMGGDCRLEADDGEISFETDDDDSIFDSDTWEDWFDKPILRRAL